MEINLELIKLKVEALQLSRIVASVTCNKANGNKIPVIVSDSDLKRSKLS